MNFVQQNHLNRGLLGRENEKSHDFGQESGKNR